MVLTERGEVVLTLHREVKARLVNETSQTTVSAHHAYQLPLHQSPTQWAGLFLFLFYRENMCGMFFSGLSGMQEPRHHEFYGVESLHICFLCLLLYQSCPRHLKEANKNKKNYLKKIIV